MSFLCTRLPTHDKTSHLVIMSPSIPMLCESFRLFLVFITLTVWRSTDQIFCKIFLNLPLSDDFFMIRLGLWVLKRKITEAKWHFHHVTSKGLLTWLPSVVVNIDPWLHYSLCLFFRFFYTVFYLLLTP